MACESGLCKTFVTFEIVSEVRSYRKSVHGDVCENILKNKIMTILPLCMVLILFFLAAVLY